MRKARPATTSALRFCASCCLTLSCWCVWIALAATLAGLAYVAIVREFPVPGFVLRRLEAQLADDQLALRFGRVRFDPTGKVLLEDVRLHSLRFEEPLLVSRQVFISSSLWSWFVGDYLPRELRFEGATLQLPAMLSPGGTVEPLVRDLAATLRRDRKVWHIDQFAGRLGSAPLTATGSVVIARETGAPPLDLGELVALYLRSGRTAAIQLSRLDAFESPALGLRLDVDADGRNTVSLLLTARSVHQQGAALPWPIALNEVAATTSIQLRALESQSLRIHLAARAGDWAGTHLASDLRAIVTAELPAHSFNPEPREAWVTASAVHSTGESVFAPVVRTRLDRWPDLMVEASLLVGGEPVAAEVEANLREKSALLQIAGRGRPAFVNDMLSRRTPRFAPFLVLGDPVAGSATVKLAAGWRFAGLTARVQGGALDSRGVGITSLEGNLSFDGRELLARDAVLRAGDNLARGSYWMDVRSLQYRMLLAGRLRPMDIGDWFRGAWWPALWGNFDFRSVPPDADLDLAGGWRDPARTAAFLRIDAGGIGIRGAEFDRVRTRLFIRPHFTHGWDLQAARRDGTQNLAGTFIRRADPVSRELTTIDFDLTSRLDPEAMTRLTLGGAAPLLNDWQFTSPPALQYAGRWLNLPSGGRFEVRFTGRSTGHLRYLGFPLESIETTGGLSGQELRLDEIRFDAAGGRGTGKASLGGPPGGRNLGFDFYLKDAELGRLVHAVQEFNAARTGAPVVAGRTDSKFLQRTSQGKIELALSANGQPGDLPSFRGSGNVKLTGAQLGEVQLFGLLSQVLAGLSLNFSTLKLDAAQSSFELRQGQLHFPDVKVTGSSAVIDAKGAYEIATEKVNFTARFKPYETRRNLLTGSLGLVLNPLSSIIELKLGGILSDPKWSYSLGQTTAPATNPSATPAAESGPSSPPADPAVPPKILSEPRPNGGPAGPPQG